MTDRRVPDPPDPFDPLWEPLPTGTRIFRVHEPRLPDGTVDDGRRFNPGFGSALRWSFFGDPPMPVHYSAATPEAAVHESVLHDAVPHAHLPRSRWIQKVLTPLAGKRTLNLAQLHSDGLRRFDLHPRDLTDTDSDQYLFTVEWAHAAHAAGADGVVWMSRKLNSVRAYCLFADRVAAADLTPLPDDPDSRIFATPADSEWLYDIALRMRVTVRPTA
ncbi:MAG: RES domain-containing protein [Nocardioides sp.]|uniref:RES domain-containing protein n=1 Tax=Nocardioides sp. TaxID=35761 RepID=UPI0039E45036